MNQCPLLQMCHLQNDSIARYYNQKVVVVNRKSFGRGEICEKTFLLMFFTHPYALPD